MEPLAACWECKGTMLRKPIVRLWQKKSLRGYGESEKSIVRVVKTHALFLFFFYIYFYIYISRAHIFIRAGEC